MVPVCRVAVSMADGASVVAFVYAPVGVVDAPGTPFAVTRNPAPVVVLHGNGESHEHMAGIIEPLARTRSVIAVDSRGHGASTRGTDPLSYELMAADALEVMSRLGVTQAHVLGFSDGGIVGLLLARDASYRVLSLTAAGANLTPAGLSRDARLGMELRLQELAEGAPEAATRTDGEDASGRYGEAELLRLMLEQPHIEPASLAAIGCPTCVLAGEHDLVLSEETETVASSIRGARLVTVPGTGHDLPSEAPQVVVAEAERVMAAGERPARDRPLVTWRADGAPHVADVAPSSVAVVRATGDDEPAVLAMYGRLLDSCDVPGAETCGWRRGFWPLPHDVSRRLREGTTWVAVDAADVADGRRRAGAPVIGAMSLDSDFGLPGVDIDWEELSDGEALTCHLLATDPAARGRGVASALLAAYAREGIRRGCRALRINTNPQSLANRLYHELGFMPHKPVYFPYEGLPLTAWTDVFEIRLDRPRTAR